MPKQPDPVSGTNILAGSRVVALELYVSNLDRSRGFYEDTLGLRLIAAEDTSAEYDAGQLLLRITPASVRGVALPRRDTTADLTFLVSDIDGVRSALESRAVALSDTLRYQIGATAGFDDPDGHRLSLYEPAPEALTWPSGSKLRAIAGTSTDRHPGPLGGSQVVYLFLFVPDADRAYEFYHETLGLEHLECRPCRRGSTEDPRGVVKYDAGGLMLTTHHHDVGPPPPGAPKAHGPQRDLSSAAMKGLAPVFVVSELSAVVEALAAAGSRTAVIESAGSAQRATFEDPFGRVYILEEAPRTVSTPGAERRRQILIARL
jgi:catechol 2,3-dioxygenase-like lactoylglutathione lyase family enzyme